MFNSENNTFGQDLAVYYAWKMDGGHACFHH